MEKMNANVGHEGPCRSILDEDRLRQLGITEDLPGHNHKTPYKDSLNEPTFS